MTDSHFEPETYDYRVNDSHRLEALAAQGIQRHFRKGVLLIQEGEAGDTLYIVLKGHLRAFLSDEHGKEFTLGTYGPWEYVGEMALDGQTRSANVEVIEDSVCSLITRDVLLRFIKTEPEFALDMLTRMIARARRATESARTTALIDVYGRLTRLLNQLADEPHNNEPRRLSVRLTHQEIGQHLACSREMVSRLMRDLADGGYIDIRDRWIWILKPLPARW